MNDGVCCEVDIPRVWVVLLVLIMNDPIALQAKIAKRVSKEKKKENVHPR
jgi:hypothetical protein